MSLLRAGEAPASARAAEAGQEREGDDSCPRPTAIVDAPRGRATPRIVCINRFYAPDHAATAQLLTDLAEHLAANGERVTVITSRLRYDDPTAALPPRETINGVAVRRVWTTRFGRAGLGGRALDYASFYLAAFAALLAELRPGDTILAKTDPPLISVPAAIAARLRGARLVNWCQDIFPEIAAALGMRWADGAIGRLLRRLRNWSLNQAAVNVVLCDSMRDHLLREGVPEARLRVIHNWADASIRPLPRSRAPGEPFTICYSGNLGRAHNVGVIKELIDRTAPIDGLAWRFVGGGAGMAELQDHVERHGIANVTFSGYAPRHELCQSLAAADAHLVTLDPACEGLIMPSKLYGVLAAGRPVIFLGATSGSIPQIINECGAGIVLHYEFTGGWTRDIEALVVDANNRLKFFANYFSFNGAGFSAFQSLANWTLLLKRNAIPQCRDFNGKIIHERSDVKLL